MKRILIIIFIAILAVVGIGTLIPYPWRIDDAPLGYQKAFYLNPIDYLK